MSFSSKAAFALICMLLVHIMLTDFAKQRISRHVEVVRKLCGSVFHIDVSYGAFFLSILLASRAADVLARFGRMAFVFVKCRAGGATH